MKETEVKKILIIGIAGGLAKITSRLLAKNYPKAKIIGVDSRSVEHSIQIPNIEYRKIRYTRGDFEKVFRKEKFDVVYHLARLSHAHGVSNLNLEQRLDMNLMGTKKILELCLKIKVKKVVVLSTYHVYGALSDNPVFINEDHPLRASIKYPELRDVVEMDQIATNWMWKNQDNIETLVLRPATIIGPQIRNTMTRYLITPYSPICADFNPMFQFVHELDMASILVRSIEGLPTGAYNIASNETLSLKKAKEILNCPTVPIPSFILSAAAKMAQTLVWSFPRYLIDYIKFACIVDNSLLRQNLGDDIFHYSTKESLQLSQLQ